MADTPDPQRTYNSLFPYYAEVCAVSQYHKKGAKPGGWGGHAGMFIGGAVIDAGSGYQRLRLVADGTDLSSADSGTGISVNQIFRNVNWVAIPGRDQFFRGGLAPDQNLDEAFYEAAVEKATRAGWFAGITIKAELLQQRPAAMPLEEFIVRHSIGTDFALNFARTAYCVRLPMSREAVGRVLAYLNSVNESARSSGYTWNMYTNNCSHVVHNALSAVGVWDSKDARGPGALNVIKDVLSVAKCLALGRMSDFSFPANTFVRAYEAGNERPIDSALAAFKDRDVVRTMNDGWMSVGPGALVVTYPMHDPARNQMFESGWDPFLFSVPKLWDKSDEFNRLTRHAPPILTDLGANLVSFRDRYAKTLASRRSLTDDLRSVRGAENERRFRAFYERFYAYIAAEIRRTNARMTGYYVATGSASANTLPALELFSSQSSPP